MIRIVVALLLLAGVATTASAGGAVVTDREASYPPVVANITHEPWEPRRGEDIRVTMHLAPDAAAPDAVSLLYCRVEPTYVCGLPFALTMRPDGRSWTGLIEWNPRCDEADEDCAFMLPDTRHIGYNLTLRYDDGARISAPTGNYWVPDTYPADADGLYYFVRYTGETQVTPLPVWAVLVAVLAAVGLRRR